jgi:ATPase family associated with various cellular activities (AAA)
MTVFSYKVGSQESIPDTYWIPPEIRERHIRLINGFWVSPEGTMYLDGVWVREAEAKEHAKKARLSGWVSDGGSRFKAVSIIERILPSDIYTFQRTDQGLFYERQIFPTDEAVRLPGLPCDYILNQISDFWNKGPIYEKYGLVHKRGILLYGPPGCGKTSIVRLLCNDLLKKGGVIFSIDDFQEASKFVSAFRRTEPDRPILTIQEDIEGLFAGEQGKAQVKAALSFLDGQDQVDNIVHIATTNEPESLADRFIKRPGRFDLVIGIHDPETETREAYLRNVFKDQIPEEKLKELVEKTAGLGLAYLREVAATNLCLDIPIDETLDRLRINKKIKVLKNESKKFGFTIGYDKE